MKEGLKHSEHSGNSAPSYAQELRDIKNMLFCGALTSFATPVSHFILTSEPQTPEVVMTKIGIGFSIGVVAGLPLGRIWDK